MDKSSEDLVELMLILQTKNYISLTLWMKLLPAIKTIKSCVFALSLGILFNRVGIQSYEKSWVHHPTQKKLNVCCAILEAPVALVLHI